MFFGKLRENGKLYYVNDNSNYSLAGYNLIYHTWKRFGQPVNKGWSINSNDLIETYSKLNNDDDCTGDNYALLIDFHPSSKDRIAIIEIEKIHVYTYASPEGRVEWSPLMLELRDVYYDEGIDDFSNDYKEEILKKIEISPTRGSIVEFLYLNGEEYYWNWGRNGMTNAVFITNDARDFFRQYF